MPRLSMTIPHALEPAEAVRRLKDESVRLKESHADTVSDLEENWQGNELTFGFSTFGFDIRGSLSVEPAQLEINANLPMAAMLFRGTVEQQIRQRVEQLLT